jgi:predicted metal-dependent hydrolase
MEKLFFDLLYCVLYGVIIWAAHTIVRDVLPFVRAKLASTQYSWAAEIIENTVRAYEQLIVGPNMGEERYRLVIEQVTKELNKLGIELTSNQIMTLVEAAVQVMNSEKLVVEPLEPHIGTIEEKPNE